MSARDITRADFAKQAYEYLAALSYRASNASATMSPEQTTGTKEAYLEELVVWRDIQLGGAAAEVRSRHHRFFTALHDGIENADISVSDADDIARLLLALNTKLYLAPHIVEYYAYTGELMEVLDFFGELSDALNWDDTMTSLHKLCCYDITKVKERIGSGEDPLEYIQLPLDIRAEFAGVSRDPEDDINHTDVSSAAPDPRELIERLKALDAASAMPT